MPNDTTTMHIPTYEMEQDCSPAIKLSEVVAWTLVSLLTLYILLNGILITAFYLYQRNRKARDNVAQAPAYEMDGNPCYETTEVKETNNVEIDIYEPV